MELVPEPWDGIADAAIGYFLANLALANFFFGSLVSPDWSNAIWALAGTSLIALGFKIWCRCPRPLSPLQEDIEMRSLLSDNVDNEYLDDFGDYSVR
jgi:hypothetical protein